MAKDRSSRRRISARPGGWRFALTMLALVSFAFQTYLFQTHIHFTPETEAQFAGVGHVPGHDKYPPSQDPANCPICQEILHSGQFVSPAAQALLPPMVAVSTIALVDAALPFIVALSHDWRGRAPPSV
jgi:hypothetical protein